MYILLVGPGGMYYHGTARRECYKMLLISSRHIVT